MLHMDTNFNSFLVSFRLSKNSRITLFILSTHEKHNFSFSNLMVRVLVIFLHCPLPHMCLPALFKFKGYRLQIACLVWQTYTYV